MSLEPDTNSNEIAAKLSRRWSLGVVALLVTVSSVFTLAYVEIGEVSGRASRINEAGRQRMLVHRIALHADLMTAPGENVAEHRRVMEETLVTLTDTQENLAATAEPQVLPAAENARKAVHRYARTAEPFLEENPAMIGPDSAAELRAELAYVSGALDRFVGALEARDEDAVQRYRRLLIGLAVVLMIVLIGITVLSVIPSIRELRAERAAQAKAMARDAARIFRLSTDLVCIAGFDGTFKRVSPSAERILGYSPEELEGAAFLDFIHPEDYESTVTATDQLAEGEEISRFENRYLTKDGQVRWLSWRSISVVEDELIFATARDVTEERRMRTRLAEYAAELERSNSELDDFAYVASHDLKAPLRDIDNLASWLEDDVADDLPEASHRHLQKIRGRIDRMEMLLDDLLDYSRVGRKEGVPVELGLEALVNDVLELAAVPESFTVDVDVEATPLTTPKAPLEQLLLNLIANAVKHHDRDDGKIEVRAYDDADDVVIVVSDDGPGIAPEFQERVFDMFQTLKPRDDVEGSGMGLALVRKIVASRDGEITLESEEGEGATFTVRLPREAARAAA